MHRSPMMRKNVFLTPLQNKLYFKEIGSLCATSGLSLWYLFILKMHQKDVFSHHR